MPTQNPINIVQITDTHLYGTSNGTLLKMNTQESLGHVLDILGQNHSNLDLILATGDIAQDASKEAYERFVETMGAFETPFRWIPGNHDDIDIMGEVANGREFHDKIVTLKNWRIIMLDTSIKGQVHGRLEQAELDFLEFSLQQAEEANQVEHCIVCLHHNPIPGNSGWMRDIGLENGTRFFEIISKFPKVKSVIYAHIHQELDFIHNGVRCFCSPSTCIQFKPNVTNFSLDRVNPGYRSFKLFADGTIESHVTRVSGETFDADYNSEGY